MKKELYLQLFGDLLTNFGVSLEIDTDPGGTETFVALGDGFTDLTESINEVVQDYQFLNKNGFGESFVTGMQPMITLTGVRKLQDAAQNFIFSKKYELLNERKTTLKLTYQDGTDSPVVITFNDVTISAVQEFSGASTDGSAISVEFKTSEKPVIS